MRKRVPIKDPKTGRMIGSKMVEIPDDETHSASEESGDFPEESDESSGASEESAASETTEQTDTDAFGFQPNPPKDPDEVLTNDGDGEDDDSDKEAEEGATKKRRKKGGKAQREKAEMLATFTIDGADGLFGAYVSYRHEWVNMLIQTLPPDDAEKLKRLASLTDTEKLILKSTLVDFIVENDIEVSPGILLCIMLPMFYGSRIVALEGLRRAHK
jgi:hypothetical protein